ncbi:hypothetical protein CT19431_MP100186 [Cupriavidus taiwanensis]|nr:hypothetical protein CT19431_MP100186 [Cupriavidus taiwanensis]
MRPLRAALKNRPYVRPPGRNAAGFVLPAALKCFVSNLHKACQRFSFCRWGGHGYL